MPTPSSLRGERYLHSRRPAQAAQQFDACSAELPLLSGARSTSRKTLLA